MTRDPVALALASLAAAASAGAAVITGGLLALRIAFGTPPPEASAHVVLPVSLFIGIVVAAVAGWLLARAIPDLFYRGLIAALGVFGALLLAALAAPADALGRRLGLAMYLVLLVTLGVLAMRKARAAAAA